MAVVLVLLVVLVVGVVVGGIASYNGVVRIKNRVESAWAQIEVQLNRRHDLIPNLVETVKGYAAHERSTLEAVVAARDRAVSASSPGEQAAAEKAVTGALANVFALSEAYPDLKASQGFASLQTELSQTEDRIAYARQYYNDSVNQYNTKIQSVPGVFVARSTGLGPREYFQAEGDARGNVTVEL